MKMINSKCKLFFSLFLLLPTLAFCVEMSASEALAKRQKLVDYAKQFVGVPYLAGGVDKRGLDCSGLIYVTARESIGLQLPRTVSAMYSFAQTVKDSEKEAGDLLFFQTVGTKISHVAIYMGNGQFIHCASDGPNTGVIVSSLSETYWKSHYYAVGRILPSSKEEKKSKNKNDNSFLVNSEEEKIDPSFNYSIWNSLKVDASFFFAWNFFNANQVLLNPRGINLGLNIYYAEGLLYPGIGLNLRWDTKTKVVQLPITFTLGINDFLRVYFGPIVTFGSPILPGTKKEISASVFPGIIGASWQSKGIDVGDYRIHFVQDVYYSVMNEKDDAALSLRDSIVAGLVFSTGVRVTFPTL